jgi:NAD(P)-dependent dehydrogenase (short-subunit alcohol dehydrogenase family)
LLHLRSGGRPRSRAGAVKLSCVDLGLVGKNALVTGASKGIGLAITQALVAEGAHVVAGARDTGGGLDELVSGGRVHAVAVDLSTDDGPAQLVAEALEQGPLDVLVNNVGAVTPRVDGFLSVTDDDWLRSMTLTFMAAVRTTRAVLPGMLAAGRGTIVNTSSVNSFLPDPAVIDYCAAKAALANFAKALSKEVGPSGIRINSVSPGPVSTGLWLGDNGVAQTVAHAHGGDAAAVAQQQAGQAPTGRFTEPQEVADLVVLLASERASNVTGADFVIDGGLVQTL